MKSSNMYLKDTFSIPEIFIRIHFSIASNINILAIFLILLPPSVKIHKLLPFLNSYLSNPIDNTTRSELGHCLVVLDEQLYHL